MLQTYKLRLSDGTVLGVDHDGLSTWLVDRRAMVQAAGSRQWQPLREFLAEERAEARLASLGVRRGQKSNTRQELPLIYPKPRKDHAPPPVPPTSAPVALSSVEETFEVEVLAAEPLVVSPESVSLPSIPEEDFSLTPEPLEGALTEEPALSAWADSPEPLSPNKPSEVQVLGEEPAFPSPEADPQQSPREEDVPLVPLDPLDADAVHLQRDLVWPLDPVEPPFISDLEMEGLAEEPFVPFVAFPSAQSNPDDDVPHIPLEPLDEVPVPPAFAGREPVAPPSRAPHSVEVLDDDLVAPPLSLQVLADDPVARPGGLTGQTAVADDELAIIPLKPLEEGEAHAPPGEISGTEPGSDDQEGGAPSGEGSWRARLEEILLRMISACYALVAEWATRLAGREGASSRSVPKLREIYRRLSARVVALTGWASRFARQDSPPPLFPDDDAAASGAADPLSSQPLKAPSPDISERSLARPAPPLSDISPVSELPVLPSADPIEQLDTGDVYESESLLHAARHWTKRLGVMAGLLAGTVVAALTWQSWFPTVADRGRMVVGELGRRVESRGQAERQEQALQEATQQLPHLAPETIRLVLSGSPQGVLDPPELFSLARDAEDLGVSALTADEANELKALRRELFSTLRPSERERIREYERVRARRVAFAFENQDVLDLFATAARVLPSRSRERLQELSGKAIAAGLVLSREATPPAPRPDEGR